MTDPPEDERVWLAAEFGPAEEGNVEETRDMVRPEVGSVRLGSSDLAKSRKSKYMTTTSCV